MAEVESDQRRLVRVVPVTPTNGRATATLGTKLITESGEQIPGVRSVDISVANNGVWCAKVDMAIDPTGLDTANILATFHYPAELPWYKRVICRVIGVRVHDITAVSDTEMACAKI